MHVSPQQQVQDELRRAALAAYGEAVLAQPAMPAMLDGAARALWRVLHEAVELDAPGPLTPAPSPARGGGADVRDPGAAPGGEPPPAFAPTGGGGAGAPAAAGRVAGRWTDAGGAPATRGATRSVEQPEVSPAPRERGTWGEESLSATEAARAIRHRELSPVELVEALLERAAAVEGAVQAWETLDPEGARSAAQAAEAAVRAGAELGVAHGVPFGVKDIFDTAGLRTAAGFGPWDGRVPTADAAAVALLRGAGGIVLGKTVATQFAFTDPSRTHNPWSPTHTPGGSSSGSGAAVAAREVPWALGSQTAGSTLRPAAYNGVVGFKPTFGLVSTRGATPLAWTLDTVGIIARSVEDCALWLAAMARLRWDQLVQPGASAPARPRLGLLRECLDAAEPEVRDDTAAAAARFARAGADVREVTLPRAYDLIQAVHRITILTEIAAAYAGLWAQQADALQPILRAGIQVGRVLPGHAYLHAQRLRRSITAELAGALDGLDAFLLPTAANVAPGMETTGDPSLQVPATLVGFPAISLPTGLSGAGLPLAVQLVGRLGRDRALLDVAAWCASTLDPMPSPAL